MARTALSWSTSDLAREAGVGLNTVNRFEAGADARFSSLEKMRTALENAGVIFIEENGEGPGVRLRKGATVSPSQERVEARVISATDARMNAADALDREMQGIDATAEEKQERRERLTAIPRAVKKARRKNSERTDEGMKPDQLNAENDG